MVGISLGEQLQSLAKPLHLFRFCCITATDVKVFVGILFGRKTERHERYTAHEGQLLVIDSINLTSKKK